MARLSGPARPRVAARRLGPAAVVACAAIGLCSCGSPSGGGASHGFALRYAQAPAMLVQCGFDRGVVSPDGPQPWYRQGRVLPLSGDQHDRRTEFSAWWRDHSATAVGGRTLAAWRRWAATQHRLPQTLCGSFATAASLREQIYPGQLNPWRS